MAVKSLLRAEGSGDIRDGAGTAPFITARDVDELQAQAGLLPHPEPPPREIPPVNHWRGIWMVPADGLNAVANIPRVVAWSC